MAYLVAMLVWAIAWATVALVYTINVAGRRIANAIRGGEDDV